MWCFLQSYKLWWTKNLRNVKKNGTKTLPSARKQPNIAVSMKTFNRNTLFTTIFTSALGHNKQPLQHTNWKHRKHNTQPLGTSTRIMMILYLHGFMLLGIKLLHSHWMLYSTSEIAQQQEARKETWTSEKFKQSYNCMVLKERHKSVRWCDLDIMVPWIPFTFRPSPLPTNLKK
jgi:hypothetical protein